MACTVRHAGERRDSANGFTLVELLVVIVVVAVLAGLSMAVVARSRRQARQTACVSNLKQIYLAWSAYEMDYPEGFFTGGIDNDTLISAQRINGTSWEILGDWAWLWMGQLEPYLRTVHTYECPSTDERHVTTFYPSHLLYEPITVGYAWNEMVKRLGEPVSYRRKMQERAAIIRGHESDHVLFIDSSFYKLWYCSRSHLMRAGFANASPVWISRNNYRPTNKDRRHPPGSNALFCDGHVENLCYEELWANFRYEGPDQPPNGYVLQGARSCGVVATLSWHTD